MTLDQQNYYETTLDNMLAGIVVHDFNTKIKYCNKQAEKILGLSLEQMMGKKAIDSVWSFIHENGELMKHEKYPVNLVISTNKPLNSYVLGINRADRDFVTWVMVNGTPIFDKNHKIKEAIINFVDITEIKSIQHKLRESRERFRILYDNSPDMYASVSPQDASVIMCNNTLLENTGYNRDELIGKPIFNVYHNDCMEDVQKAFNLFVNTGEVNNAKLIIKRKDGSTIPVSLNVRSVLNECGDILYSISCGGDISKIVERESQVNSLNDKLNQTVLSLKDNNDELKATNQQLMANEQQLKALNQQLAASSQQMSAMYRELKSSEEKFRLMYENAPVAYQSLDKDGKILDVNNVWMQWMGYEKNEILGNWFGEFLQSNQQDLFRKLFPVNIKKTETIRDVEFNLVRKDGTIINAEYTANIGRDQDGNFIRTHCVFQDVTEKKEIKFKLEENLKLIKNIMDHSTNMFYTHTVDHQLTYISPQVYQILGCSPEEAMLKWTEFLTDNPANEKGIQATLLALETGKTQPPYELELQRPDGEKVWVEVWEAPMLDDGKVIGIAGSLTDITIRKRMESDLEDQNAFLDTIINSSPIAMWVADLNGTVIQTNDSLCNLLNLSPEHIIKKYNVLLDKNLIKQNVMHQVEDVFNNGKNANFTIHWNPTDAVGVDFSKAKQLWIEVSMFPILDSSGKMINVVCQWVDITNRKNAEFKLEEQKKFLDRIIDSSALSTWISDEKGFVIRANPACLEFFGAKEEEVVGKYSLFMDSVLEEQGFMPIIEDVFNNGNVGNIIIDYNFGKVDHVNIENPAHKIINSIFTPILDENGKVTNVIVQTIDLSEIKNAEEKLKLAKEKAEESDRLKSAFLANMSHEIRTPMNGILGFTDLLKEPGLSGEKQKKYINIIQKGGERMLTTINDIIEISKIETGQITVNKKDVNINEVIRYYFDFFSPEANKKGLTFNCQIPLSDSDATVTTDKSMLDSILTNLIKNAIKYTKSGSIDFGYSVVDKDLKFFVKDSGIGITKKDQDSVFERFIQSESTRNEVYEGSGLGLSITKAYVEMLDGKIWLESKLNKGTTFFFILPIKKKKAKKQITEQTDSSNYKYQLKDISVLITEDDEAADQLLTEILEPLVKKIYHANSSAKAMKLYEDNNIDLIMMDVKIPGKDGLTLTREIRKTDQDVIIIAQTAYAMAGDREKAIDAGCNEYISKPISKNKLLEIIKIQINSR